MQTVMTISTTVLAIFTVVLGITIISYVRAARTLEEITKRQLQVDSMNLFVKIIEGMQPVSGSELALREFGFNWGDVPPQRGADVRKDELRKKFGKVYQDFLDSI
jgi:uncharacterized membrane protein